MSFAKIFFFLLLFIALVIASCNSFPSASQKKKYKSIQDMLLAKDITIDKVNPDPSTWTLEDVMELSLEGFIKTYHISKEELDYTLDRIDAEAKLALDFKALGEKMTNELRQAGILPKDSDSAAIAHAAKQSLLEKDTFYVRFQANDSTYIRKFYKGKEVE